MMDGSSRAPSSSLDNYEDDTFETTATGRESSLHRWSSITETIQFAESSESNSDSSYQTAPHSFLNSPETRSVETASQLSGVQSGLYSDDQFESEGSTFEDSASSESHGSETREDFVLKKLKILTQAKLSPNQEKTQLNDKYLDDKSFQDFYQRKSKLLQDKLKKESKCVETVTRGKRPSHESLENTRKVEELRLENVLMRIEKEKSTNFHQPKHCHKCKKLRGQTAEDQFLRQKKHLIHKQLVEKNLDKHLYEKDSATLIAEIIRAGPKPSDPPQEIWDRLMRHGQYDQLHNHPDSKLQDKDH